MMFKKDLDMYQEVFFLINTSSNGVITKQELVNFYWSRNFHDVTEYEIDYILAAMDQNGSAHLEMYEFYAAAFLTRHIISLQRMRKAFMTIDVDRTGGLMIEEIHHIMMDNEYVGEEHWREAL